MKLRNRKFIVSVLTALMMVFTLVPGMAFAAGGGGNSGGSGISLKVNNGETNFSVKKDSTIKLEATVTGVDETQPYHIHWEKIDAKKYCNFIGEDDIPIKDELIIGNAIDLFGSIVNDANHVPQIKVSVVAGESHEANCTGDVLKEKLIYVNVTDDEIKDKYEYGPQGKDVNSQYLEMLSPEEITQLYPKTDGQEITEFINRIETSFSALEPIVFTFVVGKGMGNKFDKRSFEDYAISEISVADKDGNIVASANKKNIIFLGQNGDIYRSVSIKVENLKPGDYTLTFGEGLKPAIDKDPLGVPVKFKFTVKESAKDPAPVIGDDGVMSKVVIDKKNFEITPELKEKGIATNEEVIDAMYAAIYKELGLEADENNTVVYDIKLQISTDGGKTWIDATKENFPKEGIKLELDYPEGTNAEDQDFTVMHMVTADVNGFKAGDIENLDVTEAKDKLKMTVYSLSPFSITWEDVEDGAAKNDSSAKTGDDMNIALCAGIMLAALCGGAAVFVRRRKEQ